MKKRKIIGYRLAIVITVFAMVAFWLVFGVYTLITNIKEQQSKKLEAQSIIVNIGAHSFDMTGSEYISYKRTNILPEIKVIQPVEELIVKEEPIQEEHTSYSFLITAYCDCEECQEQWVGTTALGVAPTYMKTIAVDPDVIPLGSHVIIEINGECQEFVAEDVGGAIIGNHIDIFVGSHNECFEEWCNGYHDVYWEA